MFTSSLPRLAAAVGGLALSAAAAAGVASAAPDLASVINTTCNYQQAVAALNAQNSPAAQKFNTSPLAQGVLHSFLDAPPEERQQMAEQMQGSPMFQPYLGAISQAADTCGNY